MEMVSGWSEGVQQESLRLCGLLPYEKVGKRLGMSMDGGMIYVLGEGGKELT